MASIPKDTPSPSAKASSPMVKRRQRKQSTKPSQTASDEDTNDQTSEAPWHYLSPAPNEKQGKQMQQALNPTKQDIQKKEKQEAASGKKDAFSIVLELNLEVEVTLKARIHGDLTLALM